MAGKSLERYSRACMRQPTWKILEQVPLWGVFIAPAEEPFSWGWVLAVGECEREVEECGRSDVRVLASLVLLFYELQWRI